MDILTAEQLAEWEAYDRLDPIGAWRDDYRMAYLATVMTNLAISVHAKKGTKMSSLDAHMPDWDKPVEKKPEKQSSEEMKDILLSIASKHNVREKMKSEKPKKLKGK